MSLTLCFQAKKVQVAAKTASKSASANAQKAKQAGAKKGAKAKKKSWTKVKVKETLNNAVFLDQKTYDRISKDLPKQLLVTVANISDRYKVNGSVARKVLKDLSDKGLIKKVSDHHAWLTVYMGKDAKIPTGEEVEEVAEKTTKGKKEKK